MLSLLSKYRSNAITRIYKPDSKRNTFILFSNQISPAFSLCIPNLSTEICLCDIPFIHVQGIQRGKASKAYRQNGILRKRYSSFSLDFWSVCSNLTFRTHENTTVMLPLCAQRSLSVTSWTRPATVWQKYQLQHEPTFFCLVVILQYTGPGSA